MQQDISAELQMSIKVLRILRFALAIVGMFVVVVNYSQLQSMNPCL